MKNLQEVRDLLTEKLAGKTLQYRVADGWDDIQEDRLLCFLNFCECRVKPEQKPDTVRYAQIGTEYFLSDKNFVIVEGFPALIVTRDGETGVIKHVDVM